MAREEVREAELQGLLKELKEEIAKTPSLPGGLLWI
jgi:hypothetical protein